MLKSHKISDSLHLVTLTQTRSSTAAKPVEVPTNHILCVDCSGSMSYDLPKLREQLKKKLPKMVGEKDTVTIIWFSGRNQFGALIEAEPVATLADLATVNAAIDRWLKPVGLTGFKEPMEEASKVIDRVAKARPGSAFSLFFMSDGCDNCWSRPEILKAVEASAGKLNAATFVEYGYYADRPLLTAMAEKAGGSLIFSEGFDSYAPVLENALGKKLTGAPKVELSIPGDVVGGFAFTLHEGDLLTFAVEDGKVLVPEDTFQVAYLSPVAQGASGTALVEQAAVSKVASSPAGELDFAYAAASLFATRMNTNVVLALLKSLGDVSYIEQFANCFGKQAYSAFQQSTKLAAFSPHLRLTNGFDPNKVPRDDAFTVLELLNLLSSDEGNRLMLDDKRFKYSRIGRGRVDASTILTPDEQAQVDALTQELATAKGAKKISEIAGKIAAITEGKEGLKFEALDNPHGYEVNALVWNEERPNVSVRVRKEGTVDLSGRIPENLKSTIPGAFPTFIFRNYTIIKDGLVNVETLPVKLTDETKVALVQNFMAGGHPEELVSDGGDGITLLNLKCLPVINRQMVGQASAKTLFELEWELTRARAAQKVYKDYKETLLGKRVSASFKTQYGDDATAWLKEQGFTDYSGFSPKSVQAEATDYYIGKEMAVSIKSFSSLPALKVAREKKAKGKLTPSEALLVEYIDFVDAFLGSAHYKASANQARMLEGWLAEETKAAIAHTRDLLYKKAKILFAITVGQSWFSEFSSLDQNSLEIDVKGQKLSCKVEMKEIQVKV